MLKHFGLRPSFHIPDPAACSAAAGAIALILVATVPGPARADGIPDLRGVWVAEATCRNADKIARTTQKLEFFEQDGQLVKANLSYVTAGNANIGETQGRAVGTATEPVIGAIAADGKTVRLAEVGDDGMIILEGVGPEGFSATYIEAGDHPLACVSVYRREGG
ncbi:MAG: hypothetical protein U1E14_04795 [Geminicoccaceae bacterium]